MSSSILRLCAALLLGASLALTGCRGEAPHDETVDPATGPRLQVRHFCPQHPSVTSMGPDKCRICGNLLVPER